MLSAYEDMPQYAINPVNMSSFGAMCQSMVDLIDTGVPDNTEANEQSAINKYWIPFCSEMGTNWERPNSADLTPQQRTTEDQLKAMFLPWCHRRMKGRKNPDGTADPNSATNTLRSINRVLNRHADDNVTLKKAMKCLKGMLTLYIKEYGPIQPNKALPFPKPVLQALLNTPNGTKLGRYKLEWDNQLGRHLRAMLEMAAQSGVRLDECTTGRASEWDLSKMSKASVQWYIKGQYIDDPDPSLLRNLTLNDGLCLMPATSKCDRWGDKHGHKIMFFPYRPDDAWNGCRAFRDCELHHPVRGADRAHTPLFTSTGDQAIQASFVRTVVYHMLRSPHMAPVLRPADAGRYSFHSFRKFYCTCLKQAKVPNETIQSLLRWSDPSSVDGYDMPSPEDHAKMVDAAYRYSPNAITPFLLKQVAALKIDDNDVLLDWCTECHIDLTDVTLDW